MKLLRDTWLIYHYTMRATLRNPVFVIIGLFNPICFLFLFAPLLKQLGNSSHFGGTNTLAMFLPGLLVMMGMYATLFAGFGLIDEIRKGFIERLWGSPVSRLALVLGRMFRDLTVLIVQAFLLLGFGFLSGLEGHLGGMLLSLVLIVLIGATLSSCSYMLALLFRQEESLAATINFFAVPLQLLSGITLPLTLAPLWLKTAAKFNPFSHVVDGSRALFIGNFSDSSVLVSFCLMFVLVTLALYGLVRTYKARAV